MLVDNRTSLHQILQYIICPELKLDRFSDQWILLVLVKIWMVAVHIMDIIYQYMVFWTYLFEYIYKFQYPVYTRYIIHVLIS